MRTTRGAHLSPVAGETFGEEIERRREAVGLDVSALAREAKIGRTTYYNILNGRTKEPRKRAQLLRALEAAEAESGVVVVPSELPPDAETIEFTVAGDFGVKVTVKGPIARHELLRADVAEIIRSIRSEDAKPPD